MGILVGLGVVGLGVGRVVGLSVAVIEGFEVGFIDGGSTGSPNVISTSA